VNMYRFIQAIWSWCGTGSASDGDKKHQKL